MPESNEEQLRVIQEANRRRDLELAEQALKEMQEQGSTTPQTDLEQGEQASVVAVVDRKLPELEIPVPSPSDNLEVEALDSEKVKQELQELINSGKQFGEIVDIMGAQVPGQKSDRAEDQLEEQAKTSLGQ